MKKKLVICAAMAAMVIASCQKEDVINSSNVSMGNTIEVTAMIDESPVTKSAAVVTTQSDIASFKMYIYNDGESVVNDMTFTKPTTAGNPWSHDGIYYWATGSYKFYGLAQNNSATSAISEVAVTKDGITIGTSTKPYKVSTDGATDEPKWNGSSKSYEGGIYGAAVSSVSQVDPVVAAEAATRNDDNTGTSTVTKMRFYHALSRVRVVLDSYDPKTSNLKLVVAGYEFRQVGVEGYTTSAIATNANAAAVAWTVKTKGNVRENSVSFPSEFNSTWTGNSKSIVPTDSWCNVIPGDPATALVAKVALYDKNNAFVAYRYLTTSNVDVMKASGAITAYKPGYQYTYKIKVASDGGDDTDKPKNPGLEDPNHDGPDSSVEGLTIKITEVSVEAWQDVAGGTATFTGK